MLLYPQLSKNSTPISPDGWRPLNVEIQQGQHATKIISEDVDASYNIVDNRNYRLTFSTALFILPPTYYC